MSGGDTVVSYAVDLDIRELIATWSFAVAPWFTKVARAKLTYSFFFLPKNNNNNNILQKLVWCEFRVSVFNCDYLVISRLHLVL